MGGLPTGILELLDVAVPKINPDIANGIACVHLAKTEEYIDSIFKSASTYFPDGLKYTGCRRCTPEEEWFQTSKKKGSSAMYDVAKSDVYLMQYDFSYHGVHIVSKYVYLPYVNKGGTIHIGGSKFAISPVLADKVISVERDSVFIRLFKSRLNIYKIPYYYLANGVRESLQVAYSSIYNKKSTPGTPNIPAAIRGQHTLVHYLLCKMGYSEMFNRYLGFVPAIGTSLEINTDNYPPNQFVICQTNGIKPRYIRTGYIASDILIAVPIEKHEHLNVKNFIAGFFYVLDHFPTRFNIDYKDDTRMWMLMLGLMIWNDSVSEGKIYVDTLDHIISLDEYVDSLVIDKVKEINFNIKDIYDLFSIVLDNFDEWLINSTELVGTMYDKEISVLYYVCYDLIEEIFRLYFSLKASQRKELDEKKIIKIINTFIKPGIIYRLNRNHGEVNTVSSSSDNLYFGITNRLVKQSDTRKGKGKKKSDKMSFKEPSKWLHASIADIGAVAALPKADPTGRSRVSPHLKTSPTGLVLRNEKHRKLLDDVQNSIRRNV